MKRLTIIILCAAIIISSLCLTVGCNSAGNNSSNKAVSISDSDINKIEFTDLSNYDGYFFSKCYLISESRMLIVYCNTDCIYQFKIYDLKQNRIICSSEKIHLKNMHGYIIHLLKDNFYYFYDGKCFMYDFSCKLIKELSISDDIIRTSDYQYWLSNDLTKAAYVKNENNEYLCLYLSDVDGENEEKIMPINATSPEKIFFSPNNSCIGFSGVTIPDDKNGSADCYGYINLADKKMKVYVEDNTNVDFYGDTMLILDDCPINPNAPRKGKVRTLDLASKKHSVITMNFADECEWAVLGSDTRYMVGVHLDEENLTLFFTVYRDGKKTTEISYKCKSEQDFMDLSGSDISFDVETNQIIIFGYDTTLSKNILMSLPVEL